MATDLNQITTRLWATADQLWSNTGLLPNEYAAPVLGLIFLRYAERKFNEAKATLEGTASGRREIGKTAYQAEGVIYLPEKARFSYLLELPEAENIGKAINDAMTLIEANNDDLSGVLPKTYQRISNSTLVEMFKILAPLEMDGDAFGHIYEYFMGKFAMKTMQKGGEFYTPSSLVRLIVEIIEPFHGRIFDPACGSGGMFVHSANFVRNHKKNPEKELSVFGTEKVLESLRMAKLNLAMHGLSGDIKEANTYYEDPHQSVNRFDFVMANPPFNVSSVDKERVKDDPRFPFGIPSSDNANYLWIQLFYSALNDTGRAGFVIHNSAADSELEIRKKLIEQNVVDVVITTSANLFITVNLPSSLWFFDKARNRTKRQDSILFIDATDFYQQVTTVQRIISDEQITELASIVKSYRDETGASPKYKDIAGTCKRVTLAEVKAKNYSLNPKLYVEKKSRDASHVSEAVAIAQEIVRLKENAADISDTVSQEMPLSLPYDRELLFELTKLLYKKWFINFDLPLATNIDHSTWPKVPFRDIVSKYAGGGWGGDVKDSVNTTEVRVIRGTDTNNAIMGALSSSPVRFIKPSQLTNRLLIDGDIIIEVSGGGKEQPTGRTAYITDVMTDQNQQPLICASFCKSIRINSTILKPTIAFLYLQHIYDERIITQYEVQSTGIKNFKFEYFLDNAFISLPPPKVQDKFHKIVRNIFRLNHVLGHLHEQTMKLTKVLPPTNGNAGFLKEIILPDEDLF